MKLPLNLNPILDEGAPTSTGGLINAARICDMLGISFSLDPPRSEYLHGWGTECAGARPILCSWDLKVSDAHGKPTTFTFDLVEGESPLILGLDVKRFANTDNLAAPPYIRFKRPQDIDTRVFHTYIEPDHDGNDRIRFEIVPHLGSTVSSLMTTTKNSDINLAKRLHRFTHATADEMKRLLSDADQLTDELKKACEKVYDACEICISSGQPKPRRKISLSHINTAFNDEIQADFVTVMIRGERYEVLNIVDTGTRYGERVIACNHSGDTIITLLETEWIYHHGAPGAFSADPEFCKGFFERFLSAHAINLHPRPSRSSSKNGKVERNNGVFKAVLYRLARENTEASARTLVARASFMTNLFHGSSTLSAFELARGYSPSIVGIPSTVVPREMVEAHVENTANRAIHKILRSRGPSNIKESHLGQGTPVWVFYKSSKQNEPIRWLSATVVKAGPHVVKCRRARKGPPLMVAYEDLRLAPKGNLAKNLLENSLEDMLAERGNTDEMSVHSGESTEEGASSPQGTMEEAVTAVLPRTIPAASSETDRDTLMYDVFGSDGEKEDEILPIKRTLIASDTPGSPKRDVGPAMHGEPSDGYSLTSDEQKILEEMHSVLGNAQVTRKKLGFAPPWIVEKAMRTEVDSNWAKAYKVVRETDVPRNENIISAHFVFKVKKEEDGSRRLKARLCPHGNRDQMKEDVRKDSATAQFHIIRLMLSLVVVLGFRIGVIDIKGAYLQSGEIKRRIYVRPPPDISGTRGSLWLLTLLPYGITEAGRQWQKVIEEWLLEDEGFERVFGVSQLFVKRNKMGKIIIIIAKVTDDLLMGGSPSEIQNFATEIKKRFDVSKVIIDGAVHFNGCTISQDEEGNVEMSMFDYMAALRPIDIGSARRKMYDEKASKAEILEYRSLAGGMTWAGSGVLPQAAYMGSAMQQRVPQLRVRDLCEANGMLKEMKDLKPILSFPKVCDDVKSIRILSFSDASFNIGGSNQYGQTGIITGLEFLSRNDERIYHLVDWASSKQRRVSYSSYGAEILACTEADDRGYNLKMAIRSLSLDGLNIPHVLNVDSKGLYDTITTLHEGREYRLRQTVQRIRDSFEAGDLDTLRWVQGAVNIADALTKRNPQMHRLLNRIASTGILKLPVHRSFEHNSDEWI